MSTNAVIQFNHPGGIHICTIYNHYNGFPETLFIKMQEVSDVYSKPGGWGTFIVEFIADLQRPSGRDSRVRIIPELDLFDNSDKSCSWWFQITPIRTKYGEWKKFSFLETLHITILDSEKKLYYDGLVSDYVDEHTLNILDAWQERLCVVTEVNK